MKESKKAILRSLSKDGKKNNRFDVLVLNLALQKIDSDSFEFDDEAVYTEDGKCLVYCLSPKDSFAIPEGVETIGEMAFRRKKNLRHVAIPSTVTAIARDAFYDCDSLDNVVVPQSVASVGGYAFADCDSLSHVAFAGTPKHLSRHAFVDSDNLQEITVPAKSVKTFQKALRYDPADDYYMIVANEPTATTTQEQ